MLNRRSFLRQSAILASATAFPNIFLSRPKKVLGVALVGLGYYSTDILAPALQQTKHCKLTGIVTGSSRKVPRWQKDYDIKDSNVYTYDNMHGIVDNDEIDVIYIVLPTGLHAEYAIKAADTGKHVWCEKPMARTVTECQNIIDACRKNKVKLSIGYRMQHEPNTQTIMRYAHEKPFGRINKVIAEAGYYDPRKEHWKLVKAMGGGAMYDMGVYSVNAARYSTAEEPVSIFATHSTNRPEIFTEVDETTQFTLTFPSGAVAECKTSFGERLNRLEVTCENGWYNLIPFQSYSGVQGRASDGTKFNKKIPNQQAKQMDDDALAILNNTPVLVPGEDGLKDIAIVEAAYRSAAEGRTIELSL